MILYKGGLEHKILLLRGLRVMLDKDLAFLYGVRPIALRQQVKRNKERFPEDFMMQLSKKEVEFLVSQNVIPSIKSLGGALPYVFTEQGVAMLSGVLRSKKAVQVNIAVMRAFVRLREMVSLNKQLSEQISLLERKVERHDHDIGAVFQAIRELMRVSERPKPKIGFSPP